MNQEVSAMVVLRAAVLLHLAQGGIRQKLLENFKREFLQVRWVFSMINSLAKTWFLPGLRLPSFAVTDRPGKAQPLIEVAI